MLLTEIMQKLKVETKLWSEVWNTNAKSRWLLENVRLSLKSTIIDKWKMIKPDWIVKKGTNTQKCLKPNTPI